MIFGGVFQPKSFCESVIILGGSWVLKPGHSLELLRGSKFPAPSSGAPGRRRTSYDLQCSNTVLGSGTSPDNPTWNQARPACSSRDALVRCVGTQSLTWPMSSAGPRDTHSGRHFKPPLHP